MNTRRIGYIALAILLSGLPLAHLVLSAEWRLASLQRLSSSLSGLDALQTRLGEAVLSTHVGLDRDYDDIAAAQRALRSAHDQAGVAVSEVSDDEPIKSALRLYLEAERGQQADVEEFKSVHALAQNSASYLPLIAREALEELDGPPSGSSEAAGATGRELALIVETLGQLAGRGVDPGLSETLAGFESEQGVGVMSTFIRHAKIAIESSIRARELARSITSHSTRSNLASLAAHANDRLAVELEQSQMVRRVLAVCLVLLVAAVGFALHRLNRTASSLRSINHHLEEEISHRSAALAQSQKLESIGQLAAGVAHEINTPAQYVGDNLEFLEESFDELRPLIEASQVLMTTTEPAQAAGVEIRALAALLDRIDLDYLAKEIPAALTHSREGIAHIAHIVLSMKEFSHPGGEEKSRIDLNRSIENTVTVARNEWKYVADVTLDLDPELPMILGLPAELNQVILNLVVNAAHAIGEQRGDEPNSKGTIRLRTRRDDAVVVLQVEDDGPGIPEEVRDRVFDPFFTTKEVGRGTGQGLAIARSVVVDKHAGTITVESELGNGSLFEIRLPIDGEASE